MDCIKCTKVSFSASLLWLGGVVSVVCLTLGSSKGCRTLYLPPKFSGTSSSSDEGGSSRSLSPKVVSSGGGAPVHPSKILCTHVHGLHVAVTVGLEEDPLRRKDLGLPILAPVAVVVVEVVGTVEAIVSIEFSTVVQPVVVIGTSSEGPIDTTQSCPFPGAKKYMADRVPSALSNKVGEGSGSGGSSICWASIRFTFPLVAVGILLKDPSGVTFKVETILISSCLGCVGVRCPHGIVWVYPHQVHFYSILSSSMFGHHPRQPN